ncbi:hypothetical protein F5Y06DRAFT_242855 [Hypoxylon sp. FL0890]|nr:hypothetical protein F5Y06DRAFT_242855 [Hypoxylon sp. FL0890]
MALGRWTFPTSRKQSSASSSGNRTTGSSTPTDGETQDPTKTQSRLLRSFTGGFKSNKPKKPTDRDELAHLNKPFNQQNLEHQKILSAFEWNFTSKRKSSHGGRSSISDISPSASRHASVDHSNIIDATKTSSRIDSTVILESHREDPGKGSRT